MILFLCEVSPHLLLPQHASFRSVDLSCVVGLLDHQIAASASVVGPLGALVLELALLRASVQRAQLWAPRSLQLPRHLDGLRDGRALDRWPRQLIFQ
jgi:hypothetical protein